MSGQFRDLPIRYKHMGKYENASHFALTDRNHPILSVSWPLATPVQVRVQLTMGGHGKVTWGQMRSQSLFYQKSRQDGDRDAQMMINDLAHRAALEDMHIDLLGHNLTLTWPCPDLIWGQICKLTFQSKKCMFCTGSTRRTRWCVSFLFSYLPYHKSYDRNLPVIVGRLFL